ncbi:MAG: transglutaminase domain-containing protein [Oscillospiraceae bacterium]|nr:transglutaminase domain-containing protein [Oscillospiraceae bacterium]
MKRSKKQFEQRDSAASGENTQQKGYLFAGMMILAGIVVALISAAVHRGRDGQTVVSSSLDYVTDNVTMWAGAELPSPFSFLYKRTSILVSDARYLTIPDMEVGDHDVAILVQLKDGTTRTENSVLTVKDSIMNMEAGTVATVEELLGESFAGATVEPPLSEFREIGIYSVTVKEKDGREIPFKLQVLDSTPPVAEIRQNVSFFINQEVKTDDFIESCTDMSPVESYFSEKPLTITPGQRSTQIVLVDAAGNSQTYDVQYSVGGDGEVPQIQGLTKMRTMIGVPVDYLRGVTAIDSVDGQLTVSVQEPAGFNINRAGNYTITYSAEDSAGNIGTQTAELEVLSTYDSSNMFTQEDVMRMGDYIVHQIEKTTSPVDQKAFARAIFDYVKTHLNYVNGNNNDDWQIAAVDALTLGYGDSACYYGLSRLLLTCAGYDNMIVCRQNPNTETENGEEDTPQVWYAQHFWNLVRVNGAWYHFDACPYCGGNDFFLWTDAQIDAFSAANGNCFERDKSLYPVTPG